MTYLNGLVELVQEELCLRLMAHAHLIIMIMIMHDGINIYTQRLS